MAGPPVSRKERLEELKRLRQEGGTHLQTLRLEEYVTEENVDADPDAIMGSSEYEDAEDLHDFIEDMGESRRKRDNRLPMKRDIPLQNRPLASFFKKGTTSSALKKATASKTEKDDSYFKSLMKQMEGSDDDSSEEESGIASQSMDIEPRPAVLRQVDSVADVPVPDSAIPAPPSEMFAPFDPAVLGADVARQMEEDGDWDLDGLDAALAEEERRQKEIEQLVADEQEESKLTINPAPSTAFSPDEKENTAPITVPMAAMGLEYEAPAAGEIDFYWIDAFEKTQTGTVYLFGKARQPDGSLVSCCVTVLGIQRNVYFLPREDHRDTGEEVTLEALQAEVRQLLLKQGVQNTKEKLVLRKYAFEVPDVPSEADWLKVSYGFNAPALPTNLTGATFSKVFGANTSALEILLLKRKMMGPCWLRLRPAPAAAARTGTSWCRLELTIAKPKNDLFVLPNGPPAPPLTVLSLSMRTLLNAQHQHEIVALSGLLWTGVSPDASAGTASRCSAVFTVVRDPEGVGFQARFSEALTRGATPGCKLEVARNEKALLSFLLAQLQRHDPDVLVGHNMLGFDVGVLLHRMRATGVEGWSRLGRLNWSQWPRARVGSTEATWAERQILSGRLICDTWVCAKDHVRAKNYALATLVAQVMPEIAAAASIGQEEEESLAVFGDPTRLRHLCQAPESLLRLLRKCEQDAYQQAMLMFRLMLLPLTKQLTCVAGNLWSRTLAGARAERNEFLLLHEFHAAKYICPDRPGKAWAPPPPPEHEDEHGGEDEEAGQRKAATGSGRRKPAYAGGLVLEPKRGFYDKIVLLLDFNSLYPSIIQEYNICFTTVARDESSDEIPELPDSSEAPGVLPRVLKSLVEKRAAVKRLMKDPKVKPELLAQYNIRQQALKLTANSMYGCLGFAHSRFYAKPLAMLITSRGRDILQSTVNLAQQACHLDVIYGDTDSIMINTGCTDLAQARKLAQQVKRVVNERYRLLEIELDGIFEKLLLQRKKKYAALVLEEGPGGAMTRRLETKGLDMVRRDWSAISQQASDFCLQQMMFGPPSAEAVVSAIHTHLEELAARVRAGPGPDLPLEAFIIHKNLTKDPEAYADAKGQPHVVVALRMKQRGLSAHSGDTIPYIVCAEGSGGAGSSLSERAFHPDEVRSNPGLAIDSAWYLAQQVHAPIARLCESVEGTDSARLAMCLGLDARKYASISHGSGQAEDGEGAARLMSLLSDEERFRDLARLQLTCPECKTVFEFTGPVTSTGQPGMQCTNCSHILAPQTIYCQVLGLIRTCLSTYHQAWMQCDEPSCATQTRRMRVYESRCVNDACRGTMRPKIPASRPYYQLLYLRSLFDWDKAKQRLSSTSDDTEAQHLLRRISAEYDPVRAMVLHQLNQCSFPIINLREIFSFMTVKAQSSS